MPARARVAHAVDDRELVAGHHQLRTVDLDVERQPPQRVGELVDDDRRARPRTRRHRRAGRRAPPAATTVPADRITTASHTRSTSSRRCDDRITAMPNSVPMRRMSVSIASRCIGSSPLVGSSSSSSAGSCAIAVASFTRCFCPVDIVPTGRKRSSPRPTCHRRVGRPADRLLGGQPVDLGDVANEVVRPSRRRAARRARARSPSRARTSGPASPDRARGPRARRRPAGAGRARARGGSSCPRRWRRAGR